MSRAAPGAPRAADNLSNVPAGNPVVLDPVGGLLNRTRQPTGDDENSSGKFSVGPALLSTASPPRYDRQRNNNELTLLASATRTMTTETATQTNFNGRTMILFLSITAGTFGAAPLVAIDVMMRDPASSAIGTYYLGVSFTPAVNLFLGIVGPGVGAAVTGTAPSSQLLVPQPLSRSFRARVRFVADVTDMDFSLGASIGV